MNILTRPLAPEMFGPFVFMTVVIPAVAHGNAVHEKLSSLVSTNATTF